MRASSLELGGEVHAGPHRVVLEVPDVLYLQLDGDVELEHMKVFIAAVNAYPTRMSVLRDARKARGVTSGAREYMVKNMPQGKVISFISFGAPFHSRTVITMLGRAIRVLHRDAPVVQFANTEAEAREWIDRIRTSRQP